MKLLMISTDRKIFEKGSDVALRQIEYAKKFEEMHIVVFALRSFKEISIAPNVWVYPTRSRSRWFYPFDAIRLGSFIVEKKNITHVTTEDSSLTAMAGTSLKKRFNIELEINVHTDIGAPNFAHSLENKIRKAMSLSYIPQADRIRVVSNRIKKFLTDSLNIPESKIEVRPISTDVESIRNAPITVDLHKKYPQFEKIVLMASRLEKEKNIPLAIKAMAEVVKRSSKTGLIIVGGGSEEKNLRQLVQKLGLQASVIFESWVNRETLISYYKTADVFLLTSLYEGYGLTLVEASAAGSRIISTDVGVAAEVRAKIVPYDARAIAEAIVLS